MRLWAWHLAQFEFDSVDYSTAFQLLLMDYLVKEVPTVSGVARRGVLSAGPDAVRSIIVPECHRPANGAFSI